MWNSDYEYQRDNKLIVKRCGLALLGMLGLSLFCGCSATDVFGGSGVAGQKAVQGDGGETVAVVNAEAISWGEFRELLAETSGGVILRELALDRMLRARLAEQGREVGPAADDAERRSLLASLDANDTEQAVRLLRVLRERRSLGPQRFAKLLRRNAMLRLLVRDSVEISAERLRAEYARQYGPSYRVRLLTVASRNEAESILTALRRGEVSFNELAAKVSTDISAARGGLLLPFSPKDESFPQILREVVAELLVDEISPVLPIDDQFAIVQMVERVPARTAMGGEAVHFEAVRAELELSVRRFEERRAMDVLAQELLESAEVVILDRATSGAWERQTTPR